MAAEIPIKVKLKVDASDLKKQLANIGGGIAGSSIGGRPNISGGVGTGKKAQTGKTTGTGKKKVQGGLVDLGIVVDALTPLLEPLADIVHGIVKVLGAILGIFFILEALSMLVKGITMGFNTLNKMFGVLIALVGKMVEPFVNLLLPLLIPVLIVLGMMAKMFNTLIRPLFALMMKVFAGIGAGLGQLVGQYLAGEIDFATLISGIGAVLSEAVNQVVQSEEFQGAMNFINGLIAQVAEVLYTFLALDFTQLEQTLATYLGPELAAAATMLIKVIHFFISALVGFAAQLVGQDMFESFFGEGTFEGLKEMNKGFEFGVNVASALQELYTLLTTVIIPELFKFGAAMLENPIDTLWKSFTGLLMGSGKPYEGEYQTLAERPEDADLGEIFEREGLIGVIQALVAVIQKWIEEAIQKAIDALKEFLDVQWVSFVESFDNWIAEINNWVADMAKNTPGQILYDLIKAWLGDQEKPDSENVGDAVITPQGKVIRTNPADYIFATKNPSRMGAGGGGIGTVVVNVSGSSNMNASQFKQAVKEAMEDAMSMSSRNGHFQRGY